MFAKEVFMKSKNLLFAAVIIAVIGFLFFLSSTARKPPLIPSDAIHKNLTGIRACAPCHGPGGSSPLKKEHPPKRHCFKCHKKA